MEPIARNLYQALTGLPSQPVCCIHDTVDWLRASLDGWNGAHKIVLEIKCVNAKDHQDALDGRVPEKYIPQVQHQLLVTGAKTAHYFSYTDNQKFSSTDRGGLVVMEEDTPYQENLLSQLTAFWDELQASLRQPAWLAG